MLCPQRQKGFTLIELLITLAVMGILTAAALASFSEILNEQKRTQAAAQVKNDLRSAQNRALSGIDQENYSGWGLRFTVGSNTYHLCGRTGLPLDCTDAGSDSLISLPQNVVIKGSPPYVVFQIITGENLSGLTTIKVGLTGDTNPAKWKTVTVSAGGNIE